MQHNHDEEGDNTSRDTTRTNDMNVVDSNDRGTATTTSGSNIESETTIVTTPITELELIAKLRLAFGATLEMLEAARDNLVTLGERMDRLHDTSRQCRMALLLQRQERQGQQHSSQVQQQTGQQR